MNTIGRKFAVLLSFVITFIMVVVGMMAMYAQQKNTEGRLYAKADWIVQQLAIVLKSPLWDTNKDEVDVIVRSYLSDVDILAITVKEAGETISFIGKDPVTAELSDFTEDLSTVHEYQQAFVREGSIQYYGEEIGNFELICSTAFLDSQNRQARFLIVLTIIVLICLETLALLFLVKYYISRPLRAIVRAALQIADGNIDIHLTNSRSFDEIGTLNAAFHKLIAYFREKADIAAKIATGNLTHEITYRSKHDALGKAFQEMITYLNTVASAATAMAAGDLRQEIHPKTEHDVLGNAFAQLSALRNTVQEIMKGTELLEGAAKRLAHVSTEMASGAKQNSQQARVVSVNSRQISENVNTVSSATEELAANIRDISCGVVNIADNVTITVQTAHAAQTTITALSSRSQEIGDIVKVITAITQQTNLLALNATIEAARAGDVGKGFAVVAREIKELARETAVSAEDIIKKIEAIQTSTTEAAEAMTQVSTIIEQVNEQSTVVASTVEQQSVTTNEISRGITDAALGSREINQAITEVAATSQNALEQTVSVQDAVRELGELAEHLRNLTRKFQV